MKILAVMGSPRGRGAGYRIVQMIEARMRAMGDVEFEYLSLKDANLKPCTGCYNCIARGEDQCPHKDDRDAIKQKLLAADGVILSSPLNVGNISWLMANFLNRFAYAGHRPCFHRQKVMTVVNMGGDSPRAALRLLRNALGGYKVVSELGIATPPWPQTERAIAKKERALAAATRKFYRACLDTSLPAPMLLGLVVFSFRQQMSFHRRQFLPADDAYYSGKAYYYETKINPVKAAVARVMAGVVAGLTQDKGPGSVPWPAAK